MAHWFSQPLGLALLGMLPILAILGAWALRKKSKALPKVAGSMLVKARARPLTVCSGAFCLILLALGIAGPQWGRDRNLATAPGRDIVVVLDMSRSMLAQDALGKSSPNRFGRARDGVNDLVEAIQRRGGYRLGLIIFAARPEIICPLTRDYDHVRQALASLDPMDPLLDIGPKPDLTVSGTRIGAALTEAVHLHEQRFFGHQDIVLLSDGDDPANDDEWRLGAEAARSEEIPVYAIGIGDPERESTIPLSEASILQHDGKPVLTRLHEEPLKAIARITRALYTSARTKAFLLGELFHDRIEPLAGYEELEDPLEVYQQNYAWFFAGALLFFSLQLLAEVSFRSDQAKLRVGLPGRTWYGEAPLKKSGLVLTAALLAFTFAGADSAWNAAAWLQMGDRAFDRADYSAALDYYTKAEERITDPGLVAFNKAGALYRLGRFREAEWFYRRSREDASGRRLGCVLYDLGNSLVQQGQDHGVSKLEQAIEVYQECLRCCAIDPDLAANAQDNLKIARSLLAHAKAQKQRKREDEPGLEDGSKENKDKANENSNGDHSVMGSPQSTQGAEPASNKSQELRQGPEAVTPTPGVGNLPPVPDQDQLVPLSPEETAAYLQSLVTRVLRERREHKQLASPRSSRNALDW